MRWHDRSVTSGMKVRKSDKKTVRETPRVIPTSRRFKFYLKWIKCFSCIPWLGPNAGISSSSTPSITDVYSLRMSGRNTALDALMQLNRLGDATGAVSWQIIFMRPSCDPKICNLGHPMLESV